MATLQITAYRPFRTLTYSTAGIFGLLVITTAVPVLLMGSLLIEPELFVGHEDAGAAANVVLQVVGVIETVLRIACIVVFLVWVYRGFVNLTAISSAVLDFSPGAAIGWWFVPFVNIVRGYQIVRELWTFSVPDASDDEMFAVIPSAPWWMIIWWLSFVVGNVFLRVSTMITPSDIEKFGGMELLWGTIFIGGFLHIISALLLIRIMLGVNSMQEARYAQQTAAARIETPPPPVFSQDDRNETV